MVVAESLIWILVRFYFSIQGSVFVRVRAWRERLGFFQENVKINPNDDRAINLKIHYSEIDLYYLKCLKTKI